MVYISIEKNYSGHLHEDRTRAQIHVKAIKLYDWIPILPSV